MDISDAKLLLQKKLGSYCLTSCPAKCCKIGKILVTKALVDKYKLQTILRADGYYDLTIQGGCSLMKNNSCSVFTDPCRPKMCGDYPFFERGKTLLLASSCQAVTQGLFKEDLDELTKKGLIWDIQ